MTIGGRYQLLARSGTDEDSGAGRLSTWRARDGLLHRDVMLRIHAPGGPAARGFLDRALAAGVLSHPALAMVYDAVDEDRRAYVVSEWVEGTSLAATLDGGPLSERDARETIRRVAEGVAQAHDVGLAVGGLVPDRVILTPTGSVTVTAIPAPVASPDSDVRALGALLFASMAGFLPADGGCEPDPAELDRQLSDAAAPDLAEIALAALDGRLSTAGEMATQLVAGRRRRRGYDDRGYDRAYGDRGHRDEDGGLAFITDHYEYDTDAAVPDAGAADSPWPSAGPVRDEDYPTDRTRPIAGAAVPLPAPAVGRGSSRGGRGGGSDADPPEGMGSALPGVPAPTIETDDDGAGRRRTWLVLAFPVAALLAVALIGWVIGSSFNNPNGTPAAQTTAATATSVPTEATTPAPTTALPPTPVALSVDSATVYDPFGDGEPENNDDSSLAFDGDPGTSWPTLTYRGSPLLGNLKPGVGLVFDLGQAVVVSEVTITTDQPGATVELLTGPQPDGDFETFQLAAEGELEAETALPVDAEQPARYWLVWITELVPDGGDFSASLAEVTFTGVPAP